MNWFETETRVRFNEVDQWGIAWYGHYTAWFEVGRMDLLRRMDLGPEQMEAMGYIAPVVHLNCDFKHPARFDERIVIRTTVEKPEVAALTFRFEVIRSKDRRLLARGKTTQVLLTSDGVMIYRLGGELERRVRKLIDSCTTDGRGTSPKNGK
jgi:acyl-CoA thioester hydrolase